MVELRKRPAPKEPAAPPPAAKRKTTAKPVTTTTATKAKPGPKAKDVGGVVGGGGNGSTDTKPSIIKKVARRAKEAVTGVPEKEVDEAAHDSVVTGKGLTSDTTGTGTAGVEDVAQEVPVESETGMIPETAGTAPTTVTVPTTADGDAGGAGGAGADAGVAGSAVDQSDEPRPETSEALENPPEIGKVELATSAAAAAVAGGALGPASASGSASGLSATAATVPLSADSVGKLITLEGFGGVVETHEGKKVSVKDLLGEGAAKGGIVIFTYPRASTPGCTTQACLFRDAHPTLTITPTNLTIYGLSTDSPRANTTFATKQKLPYELLCDPTASLTGALGMKKGAKSTARGVVVVDGMGVVKVWFQGGPKRTLEVVEEFVASI